MVHPYARILCGQQNHLEIFLYEKLFIIYSKQNKQVIEIEMCGYGYVVCGE